MKIPIHFTAALLLLQALPLQAEVTITWQPPQNASVPLNRESRIAVEAEGTGTLTYQWYKNDSPIAGATQAQLQLAAFASIESNRYQVKISDADSTVWGDEITLTVFDVAEQLGLSGLTFVFEETPTQYYHRMVPEDGAGVSLKSFPYYYQLEPYIDRPVTLKLLLDE
ncbi:MAG: hypothetical protein KJT03_24845, partial [Verrucomicrobiae bacterium]|nr:hypothetical protein [Verrucomicrobiae bacterium]